MAVAAYGEGGRWPRRTAATSVPVFVDGTRIAFKFKHPHALIALAMLSLGGYRPALPGR